MRFTLRPNANDDTTFDLCQESDKGATKPFCWVMANLSKDQFLYTPDCQLEDIEHWIEQEGYYEVNLVGVDK